MAATDMQNKKIPVENIMGFKDLNGENSLKEDQL